MAAKTTTFDNDLLKLIFNATTIANIAINATASPITNIYLSLHTASPGVSGDQTTNEIAYTGYARIAITRDNTGWTVTGASVSPAALVVFGAMTAGAGGTVTHVGVGTAVSGTGKLLYYGPLTPNINVVNGVTPELATTSTVTES